MMAKGNLNRQRFEISISGLPAGFYTAELLDGAHSYRTSAIVMYK